MSKGYEEYKDSGIEWLGEIPAHWDISFLKHTADFINGAAFKPESWQDEGIPIVRIQNLNGSQDFNYVDPSLEVNKNCHLSGGELLFSWSGNIGTSFGPFFWQEDTEAYLNQHIFKVANYELHTLYFYWLLKAVTKYIESKTHGIIGMVHITKKELGAIPIPKISYEEQAAIGDYISYKTGQIDRLLAQKEQLINLLQKKRQAIINEAVTHGLNSNVSRRDSGIEWLGEIPVHWEVSKLKYLLDEPLMYGANEAAEDTDPTQPRYIRITDFGSNGKLRTETFKSLKYDLAKDYFLKEGDILFARSGATVGKTFIFKDYKGEACFAGYLIKASIDRSKAIPEFVDAYTKSSMYENWKNSIFIQSTIQNISADKYKSLIIPVPPVEEQVQIMQYLCEQYLVFDNALEAIEIQVSKLKSYRQSIINEVVRGKVDVREVALNEA